MIHLLRAFEAAEEVQKLCERKNWKFCFIGGLAVQRWGEPRMTQDADLTLLTGFGSEERFIDTLLEVLSPRRPDARAFALQSRVLLAQTGQGIPVDIALGGLPFEERSVERSSPWCWQNDRLVVTCSAEDLIVHKVFAGRDLDWSDVERILVRQHGKLNLQQIVDELKPLLELKGELKALGKFEQKVSLVERRLQSKKQ